jgi:hypothetical protein
MNISELLSNRILIAFLIIVVIAVIVGVFIVKQSTMGVVGESSTPGLGGDYSVRKTTPIKAGRELSRIEKIYQVAISKQSTVLKIPQMQNIWKCGSTTCPTR